MDLYVKDLGVTISEDERNEMLADEIPATTLPVGGPAGGSMIKKIVAENIIDMQKRFVTCWPEERLEKGDTSWKHSDLRNVPYLYIHKIFTGMLNPKELEQ
jgi:hypothetical protein